MGLWNPAQPDALAERIMRQAPSTRRVRFEHADVESEIAALARQAATALPALKKAFEKFKAEGWKRRDAKKGREKHFAVAARDFGEFLIHGPACAPTEKEISDFIGISTSFVNMAFTPAAPMIGWGNRSEDIPV